MRNPDNKLGIIIPAYKPDFLQLALESILRQTNQNFDLYVFNDHSPYHISPIIRNYSGFFFHEFEENLGGKNLVEHWHRCLEYVNNAYIWLFSDDDIASPTCVESFYREIENNAPDVLIMPVEIIDSYGNIKGNDLPSPDHESAYDFLVNRLKKSKRSYLPDHIFNKKALKEYASGKIPDFPKAWNSDDALWLILGEKKGIKKITDCTVYFRNSGINISSMTDNDMEKVIADYQFIHWLKLKPSLWTDEIDQLLKNWMRYRFQKDYSISIPNFFQFVLNPEIVHSPFRDKYFLIRYSLLRSIFYFLKRLFLNSNASQNRQ